MDDMFQQLIDKDFPVEHINIKDGWFELDTEEDIANAEELLSEKQTE